MKMALIVDIFCLHILLQIGLSRSANNDVLAEDYVSRVKLYRGYNCEGEAFETYEPVTNLGITSPEWNDNAFSAQIRGAWIFYQGPDFHSEDNYRVEYVFSNTFETCNQFKWIGGKITSLQYAGNKTDFRQNTVTLYKRKMFQGGLLSQSFLDRNEPYVATRSSSLIITGALPWELFEEAKFQGKSYCVVPPPSEDNAPFFLYDYDHLSIPYDFPRSATKGCSPDY